MSSDHHFLIRFAGRKLVGLSMCLSAVVLIGFGAYGMVGMEWFDADFATEAVISLSAAVGTLYATFCGANWGEHKAKALAQSVQVDQAIEGGGVDQD